VKPLSIARIEVRPLDAPLREAFEIAGGAQPSLRNVLVEAVLDDGSRGWGECAPLPAYNGETREQALSAARAASLWLRGMAADRHAELSEALAGRVAPLSARAGIETAVLDAWARSRKIPLWVYFGGAGSRLASDVTIPILPDAEAASMARSIRRFGVDSFKIKVGREASFDSGRVIAAVEAGKPRTLILDGNSGYSAAEALKLLRALRRGGIRPDLFEQPTAKEDLEGSARVAREGGVPVAADESAGCPGEVLKLARLRAAQVVNVKIMKGGVRLAWETARAARSAGLGLMIGGMVESGLAMGCSAHLAAGLGGFSFVDLDTPLLLAKDPMTGLKIRRGGVYDLSGVRSGIGVRPRLEAARRIPLAA
jgi:L-alanine-DL-glutamate epimerase-like enolase superfamily enzyme